MTEQEELPFETMGTDPAPQPIALPAQPEAPRATAESRTGKRYKCEECGKELTSKQGYKGHFEKYHPKALSPRTVIRLAEGEARTEVEKLDRKTDRTFLDKFLIRP